MRPVPAAGRALPAAIVRRRSSARHRRKKFDLTLGSDGMAVGDQLTVDAGARAVERSCRLGIARGEAPPNVSYGAAVRRIQFDLPVNGLREAAVEQDLHRNS